MDVTGSGGLRPDGTPPVVDVTSRRWVHYLTLTEGCMAGPGWIVVGTRRRAERVAHRKLARYARRRDTAAHWGVP